MEPPISNQEAAVKLKVYVIDLEIPAHVKRWTLRIGALVLVLGGAAIAIAATPLHTWATGDTLQATDLNGNFTNLQAQINSGFVLNGADLHSGNTGNVGIGTMTPSAALDVNGAVIRKIARVHGNGPNDGTANGAIATRLLQYTKTQDATAVRIVWSDNIRCYGATVSCEWEIKIDGASCAMPGPLTYDVYSDIGATGINVHRPHSVVGTCFGISKGPHTIQVYVKAPASMPTGGAAIGNAGAPFTGWNAAYWSIEAEEVY